MGTVYRFLVWVWIYITLTGEVARQFAKTLLRIEGRVDKVLGAATNVAATIIRSHQNATTPVK